MQQRQFSHLIGRNFLNKFGKEDLGKPETTTDFSGLHPDAFFDERIVPHMVSVNLASF
jgi:hypothetical protein